MFSLCGQIVTGILSGAGWLEENILGLHDLIAQICFGLLPDLMLLSVRISLLSDREAALYFIREGIRNK